jgi:ribose-phosphate pyrophosphokinase
MSGSGELALFAVEGTREYGERVAQHLDLALAPHEERGFEDGEHKIRPLVEVRRHDVYVIHALYGDARESPNDKLCRLLFFIGALKDAGAARVTAVLPYLAYARKDRRTQTRDPITTKYVARCFEACGTDAVITVDVHNLAAFENAFRCPVVNLEAIPLFVEYFAETLRGERLAVVSPDAGGLKRADRFRRALAARVGTEPEAAFVEKYRGGGVVTGELWAGEVAGRAAIIFDDLISTGTTLVRAASVCRAAGARQVFAAATHGLFIGEAPQKLADPVFEAILVTDTVSSRAAAEGRLPDKIRRLDSSKLVAEAIIAAHAGR